MRSVSCSIVAGHIFKK